jgi:hypothetical protein
VLEFLETPFFTRAITQLLHDSEYAALQGALIIDPEAGELIQGSGGLRKIRWQQSRRGKGKRGGIRVIYYLHMPDGLLYMLIAYAKGEKEDLSGVEKRMLKRLVEEEFK